MPTPYSGPNQEHHTAQFDFMMIARGFGGQIRVAACPPQLPGRMRLSRAAIAPRRAVAAAASTPGQHMMRVGGFRKMSSWVIMDYANGARSAGFADVVPPPGPVILALLGAYPFVHFALLLAPHERREELVTVHNGLVRALESATGIRGNCLKVYQPQDASRWLQTYGAIILSFMSAVHWGATTARAVKGAGTLSLLASIVPAIAAWAAINVSKDVNPPRADRDKASERSLVIPEAVRPYVSASPADLHFPSPNSVLAGGFLWVLVLDVASAAAGRLPAWYVTYRLLLTIIVTSSLKIADVGMEGGKVPHAFNAVLPARSASDKASPGVSDTDKDGSDRA